MVMVMMMMMIWYAYDTYDTLVMRKVFFAVEVHGFVGDSDFDFDGSGV
jgi:hypothetical protein